MNFGRVYRALIYSTQVEYFGTIICAKYKLLAIIFDAGRKRWIDNMH